MVRKEVLVIILFLLIIQGIRAFPISPAKSEIDFMPNEVVRRDYFVGNKDDTYDLKVIMHVEGDLNESFELETTEAIIKPKEMKQFFYTIKMPPDIKPGVHSTKIVATEDIDTSGVGIRARVAVATTVNIRKPYPGKYIEIATFEIPDTELGKPVKISVKGINRGSENIKEAYAATTIQDPDGKDLAKLNTKKVPIESQNSYIFTTPWENYDVGAGHYWANLEINYDGEKRSAKKKFRIGDLNIIIKNVTFNDVKTGSIAKFEIEALSQWNGEIKDTYALLTIKNLTGVTIDEVSTPSVTFIPWSNTKVLAYWPTEGVTPGAYTVDIVLKYADKESLKKTVTINVLKKINIALILGGIIAALIIIIIMGITVYLLRNKKTKRKR